MLNEIESRLLQVRRLSQEQVRGLHDLETRADQRWRQAQEAEARRREETPPGELLADRDQRHARSYRAFATARGPGWREAGVQFLLQANKLLPPFFTSNQPESERRRLLEAWQQNASVKKACALARAQDVSELQALHAADDHHWRHGPEIRVKTSSSQLLSPQDRAAGEASL